MNIYKLLSKAGFISIWLEKKEKEAAALFGFEFKLWFEEVSNNLAVDAVCKVVSEVLDVPINLMISQSREENIREARQISMYLCKSYIPLIQDEQVGNYFNRERTTVISSVNRVNDLLNVKDRQFIDKFDPCLVELQRRINE